MTKEGRVALCDVCGQPGAEWEFEWMGPSMEYALRSLCGRCKQIKQGLLEWVELRGDREKAFAMECIGERNRRVQASGEGRPMRLGGFYRR